MLDVGTGSGAIALALAHERPKARVTATDVSPAALAVAADNAERLGLADRVRFLEGSLFEPVAGERFDLVVVEPALRRAARRRFAAARAATRAARRRSSPDRTAPTSCAPSRRRSSSFVAPGGAVFVELDPAQAPAMSQWLADAGLETVTTHRDAAGRARVVAARRGA